MKDLLVLLSVGTFLATGLVRGGDAKKDTAGLQGTWKADLGEKKLVVTFKGNKFHVQIGDENYKGSFKIDPTKKPKHIDMTVKEGDKFVKMTSVGIYELKGDTLKWAANEPGKDVRPDEFAEREGMLYAVLARQKKKKD
ncbi:MAG TPA: TIGR03067 domain-containing protein [Gemmataceae bacterium]|nr:TIGR03067 domain-containing protein [Gemmataceae bacterium]